MARNISLSGMTGHSRIHHLTAPVATHSALNIQTSGFTAIRHNEVRDITASFLLEVHVGHGMTIELHLQPLTGEVMSHNSVIVDNGACLDFAMYGFGEAVSRRHL